MNRLEGKVAFITGAGSGIGRGMALRFAEEGADIGCFDLSIETAEETAELVRNLGQKAITYEGDVRKSEDLVAGVEKTVSELGDLWVACANAGINAAGTILTLTEEDWQRVIDVNLTGVFLTCQAAARQMVEQGKGGRIISTASVAAEVAYPGWVPYCATKAGVRMMTRSMAQELAGHKITVNSIGPGPTATNFFGNANTPEFQEQAGSTMPLGRMGQATDMGAMAAFIASDDGEYATGSYFLVDGGMQDSSVQAVVRP